MSPLFPFPDLAQDPGDWPGMTLYAATVYLEAAGESERGRLAVAWVIKNRILALPVNDQFGPAIARVILGPDGRAAGDGRAFEPFSCWNDDYMTQRGQRLTKPDGGIWSTCWRAAVAAYYGLAPDPTRGSNFYLNVDLTRKIRPNHDLPSWFDPLKVMLVEGHHTFLRA